MGGVVSSGETNEELVDNLCKERYIVSPEVEKVFRIIDRQKYMVFDGEDENPLEAYEDHAWRRGNLHLSAPCIYTKAMESLQLSQGYSFLNIGSGTGYFSTMAGLLLGPTGINHGIEIYEDNVEFAQEKLKEFKETSPWYDPVEFCEPVFITGNALLLSPSGILYDRIYCGAACPTEHVQLLHNLLKVDGILVMPCESYLVSVARTDEQNWDTRTILSTVSFAPLILPSARTAEDMTAITIKSTVSSLKEQCRLAILSSLKRDRYKCITELPLPIHLQQYVSFDRTWETLPEHPTLLCPMELGEDEEENAENDDETASISNRSPGNRHGLNIRHIGNRQALIININGMLIQLPIEDGGGTSDDDSQEDSDEPL